jgi:DNA-binding XRE family transcriptional regulator
MSKPKAPERSYSPSVPWSLEEHLKDPEVKAAYDALEGEFALIRQLIDLRIKRGLSQRQLAKRAEMQQPTIARLEGGRTASLKTLRRVAEALDARVEVRLVPREASGGKRARQKRT